MLLQIAELQNRHDHSSMSLNEQKKLLAEIDRLKAFRTTAAGYDERVKSLEGMDVDYNSIREELKQLDNELNANKARQVFTRDTPSWKETLKDLKLSLTGQFKCLQRLT